MTNNIYLMYFKCLLGTICVCYYCVNWEGARRHLYLTLWKLQRPWMKLLNQCLISKKVTKDFHAITNMKMSSVTVKRHYYCLEIKRRLEQSAILVIEDLKFSCHFFTHCRILQFSHTVHILRWCNIPNVDVKHIKGIRYIMLYSLYIWDSL